MAGRSDAERAPTGRPSLCDVESSSSDSRWNALMSAAQTGDDRAYGQLVAEVGAWLSRYFHKRLPPALAEDATQEALLAVHLHKQKYQPDRPMIPWLRTIAWFKFIDQVRDQIRTPSSLDDADVPVPDHGIATRTSILLDVLLAELKPSQAEVIRLVKVRGNSIEEASNASGQSPSLVKVNIHRGLKRIQQSLSD